MDINNFLYSDKMGGMSMDDSDDVWLNLFFAFLIDD